MEYLAVKEVDKLFQGHLKPLNDGQRALLRLVTEKYQNGGIVQYEELEIIYKEKVQRYKSAKRGLWDSQEGWIEEPRKYFDWEIDQMLQAWVLRALGALIKKGYLTVIPRISLNKISLEEVKS